MCLFACVSHMSPLSTWERDVNEKDDEGRKKSFTSSGNGNGHEVKIINLNLSLNECVVATLGAIFHYGAMRKGQREMILFLLQWECKILLFFIYFFWI